MKLHPLFAWRRENGMAGYKLAAEAAITHSYLSKIEHWRAIPALPVAVRLSRLTGWMVRPEQFLPDYEPEIPG